MLYNDYGGYFIIKYCSMFYVIISQAIGNYYIVRYLKLFFIGYYFIFKVILPQVIIFYFRLNHYSIWVRRLTFGHRLCISMNLFLCDWVCYLNIHGVKKLSWDFTYNLCLQFKLLKDLLDFEKINVEFTICFFLGSFSLIQSHPLHP